MEAIRHTVRYLVMRETKGGKLRLAGKVSQTTFENAQDAWKLARELDKVCKDHYTYLQNLEQPNSL